MSAVTLRGVRPEDLEGLAELHHAIWIETQWELVGLPPQARDLGWYRRVIEPTLDRTVVAEREGAPVGYVTCLDDLLDDIWVAPWAQGQGVGALLLRAGEEVIRACGHAEARLECIAANARARRFYERHGWRLSREFSMDEPRPGLRMTEYRRRVAGVAR